MDTAVQLRNKAALLRGDTPTAGYTLLGGISAFVYAAGTHGGRLTPEEILQRYQVPPDPDGAVRYPPFPMSLVTGQRTITRTEAEMLDELGILGQKDFKDLGDSAYDTADERFPDQGVEDGHNDAFRHAYWNALMVSQYGEDWARRYANAHEGLAGNPADREAMDLYNNEVGRRIAVEHPDAGPEELADLVEQAVRDGEMVVIPPDGGVTYSDQLAPGETGDALLPPEEPADGAESDSSGSTGSGDRSGDYDSGGSSS